MKIELSRTPTGWIAARFDEAGNPDPAIVELFGDHRLPTAFTAQAPAAAVQQRIQELNPDFTVTLAD